MDKPHEQWKEADISYIQKLCIGDTFHYEHEKFLWLRKGKVAGFVKDNRYHGTAVLQGIIINTLWGKRIVKKENVRVLDTKSIEYIYTDINW